MDNSNLKAYTDGAHVDGNLGWAFVIMDENGNVIAKHSGKLEGPMSLMKQRNVAAEIKAAMMAAAWAKDTGRDVEIMHDYEGVSKWPLGQWGAKNQWTRKYRKYMRGNERVVGYEHVKGHTGVEGNELADDMAEAAARQKRVVA